LLKKAINHILLDNLKKEPLFYYSFVYRHLLKINKVKVFDKKETNLFKTYHGIL